MFDIRDKEGNYVMFVVIANFVCALLDLTAGYGFFTLQKWTTTLLNFAVGVLVITFIGLGIHIYSAGIYEQILTSEPCGIPFLKKSLQLPGSYFTSEPR